MKGSFKVACCAVVLALSLTVASSAFGADMQTSSDFKGLKANSGKVSLTTVGGKTVLTLSDDFVAPEAPDVHWMIMDSSGTTYVLDRLMTKTNQLKKSITVPGYVPNVAKVVMWCAFAETNLGEVSFNAMSEATPASDYDPSRYVGGGY